MLRRELWLKPVMSMCINGGDVVCDDRISRKKEKNLAPLAGSLKIAQRIGTTVAIRIE